MLTYRMLLCFIILKSYKQRNISHLITKNYSFLCTIFAGMYPSICWEKDGATGEAMYYNLHEVELVGVKICDDNSTRAAKIRLDSDVSSILDHRRMVRWLRQPTPYSSLHAPLPRLSSWTLWCKCVMLLSLRNNLYQMQNKLTTTIRT